MLPGRVLVIGASGSGTTTLGRALATAWACPHADADDFFWVPTDPPYVRKRPEGDRVRLMNELFVPRPIWVLSGSIMGWGDAIAERLDAAVFLRLDPEVRMGRLYERERGRYGAALHDDGAMAASLEAFLEWARGYDDEHFDGRNIAAHKWWLSNLPCPVLNCDSAEPVAALLKTVLEWFP